MLNTWCLKFKANYIFLYSSTVLPEELWQCSTYRNLRQAEYLRGRSWSPDRGKDFLIFTLTIPTLRSSCLHNGYPGLGGGTYVLSPELKRPRCEADYSPPAEANIADITCQYHFLRIGIISLSQGWKHLNST